MPRFHHCCHRTSDGFGIGAIPKLKNDGDAYRRPVNAGNSVGQPPLTVVLRRFCAQSQEGLVPAGPWAALAAKHAS